MSEVTKFHNSDYNEILRQHVAEIRSARTSIAKQVNSTIDSAYWSLGKGFSFIGNQYRASLTRALP